MRGEPRPPPAGDASLRLDLRPARFVNLKRRAGSLPPRRASWQRWAHARIGQTKRPTGETNTGTGRTYVRARTTMRLVRRIGSATRRLIGTREDRGATS